MTNEVHSVVGAGIVRTFYLGKATGAEFDKTWYGFDVYAASVAECNIAIICACAPSLKSITGRFFHSMGSIGSNKNTGSGNSDDNNRDLKKGKNIQLLHFIKILTLLFQVSIQGLNRATALPPPYLYHQDQNEILSFTVLESYFVTCQDASRSVQPAKKPRSVEEICLPSQTPMNMDWIA